MLNCLLYLYILIFTIISCEVDGYHKDVIDYYDEENLGINNDWKKHINDNPNDVINYINKDITNNDSTNDINNNSKYVIDVNYDDPIVYDDAIENCKRIKEEESVCRHKIDDHRREAFLYKVKLEHKEYCERHCCHVNNITNTKRNLYLLNINHCGEVMKSYPPCKALNFTNGAYPNCCPQLVCPPYFSYLDAYLYTYSLIVSKGEAPLIYGIFIPPPKTEYTTILYKRLPIEELTNDSRSTEAFPTIVMLVLYFCINVID